MGNTALTVYKASAGSGKTFRLAVEYIKQLIRNPKAYEGVLAVTFTNKATEEMKMRIISQLYGIANSLPSSESYLECICKELSEDGQKANPDYVRSQASLALHNLLHSYSNFKVQTIDGFFQVVLRNLARELNLSPNLKVELGDNEIESRAVDTLIEKLTKDDVVLEWILDYIRSNMDDQKNWNVISNLKNFGKQLLCDEYKSSRDKLSKVFESKKDEMDFFKTFTKSLRSVKSAFEEKVREYGASMNEIFVEEGISVGDLNNNIRGYISALINADFANLDPDSRKTVATATDDANTFPVGWVTKSTKDKHLIEVALTRLRPLLKEFVGYYKESKVDYLSAKITLAHLSELRLLDAIRHEMEEGNRENDRFLLSETQTLLNKMIDDSDTPFIYEKIGSRLHQIMIDEFQDTSRIQWQNFKVLLSDCMSHGRDNLIVGDVKQSIYRWRSGDWRLINNMKDEFVQGVFEKSLSFNHRSTRNVVEFNNAFFRNASRVICNIEAAYRGEAAIKDLRRAYQYSTLRQIVPDGKSSEGLVKVFLLKNSRDEYKDMMRHYIVEAVKEIKTAGHADSSIAILVRKNKEISGIAELLTEHFPGVKFVSEEAFSLSSSSAVMIIIEAMKLLVTPDDRIIRASLAYNYQRAIIGNTSLRSEIVVKDLDSLLPPDFMMKTEELIQLPLLQLAEKLFHIFEISKLEGQNAFVSTLFDHINSFVSRQNADVVSFVKTWEDEKIYDKKIVSNNNDGIRIITIHKSKGLEFDNVICPNVDWAYVADTRNLPILWCHSDVAPYSDLPVIPLDYKKDLKDTVYVDDYYDEHMQMSVDNLNLLYVAFTRASKNLYILGKNTPNDGENVSSILTKTMTHLAKKSEEPVTRVEGECECEEKRIDVEQISHNDGTEEFVFGTNALPEQGEDKPKEQNVFIQPAESLQINTIESYNREPEFRQSNASKEFTEVDESALQTYSYISLGNLLHALLSSIKTVDDLPSALLRFEMDGLLQDQDITYEEVAKRIDRCLENEQVRDWFSDRWQVYNECSVYEKTSEGDVVNHRPDRVVMSSDETIVIDFKLNNDKPEYHDQVRRYVDLLKRMGYPNVHGYLLLLLPARVVEVNDKS